MKLGIGFPIMHTKYILSAITSVGYPAIVWVHDNRVQANSVAASWNKIARSLFDLGCDLVMICNDDLLFAPSTIQTLVERTSEEESIVVTACNVKGVLVEGDWRGIYSHQPQEPFTESEHPDFAAFMFTRKTWETVGEFDENFRPAFFEDNCWHARLAKASIRAICISGAPYYHFGSRTQNADPHKPVVEGKQFDSLRLYFERKWGHACVNDVSEMKRAYFDTPFGLPDVELGWWPRSPQDWTKIRQAEAERRQATGS